MDNWNSICSKGILADYNKDTSDALDFGYGFYLAPTQERSERYITGLLKAGVLRQNIKPIILCFEFCPLGYFQNKNYNSKILNAYDDEFANFIFENRTENIQGQKQHNFDIIFGVMSDSIPTKVINEYKMGKITKEDAIKEFKRQTSMKQLSLHNQNLCDILILKEAYELDSIKGERKELNLSDYYNR